MDGTGPGDFEVGVVLRVLGSPLLELDGRAQPLPPGRPGRLVAALLVARGRVVTDDRLVDEVWGEDLPADARAALHTNVGRARRALGTAAARLERVAAGYRFDLADVSVDADEFVATLARARGLVAGDPVGALAAYDAALRLWQGPAWAGFADDVAQGEALRLEESLLAAREEHAETLLALGRAQEAADELRPLVSGEPLRDRPALLLIRALHRLGSSADALAVFAAHRAALAEELGLDPSPELEEAQREVLERTPAPTPAVAAPVVVRASALVGREADLEQVRRLLTLHRCVTVLGPGGVGKTSLAREVMASTTPAWWVDLTSVTTEAGVRAQVAAALDVEVFVGGSLEAALEGRLAAASGLLVLDNCEHVLGAAADLVAWATAVGGGIRVLATSRERLGVPVEQVCPLAPLRLPTDDSADPDVPAVALFLDRARAAAPELEVTPDVLGEVNELVRRLDGLPLAIELAASRVGVVPLRTLRDRLDHRLDLLRSHHRRGPARHQTLADTIDWSYDLLDEDQRRALRWLSVFAGPFDLDAAEAVLGPDSAEQVLGLVERSLVVRPARSDDLDYRLLETVRAFARDRLEGAEAEAASLAHARWARDQAALARVGLAGRYAGWWGGQVERLLPELALAVLWAVESGHADEAVEIVPDLYEWGYWRVRADVLGWATMLLESGHPGVATTRVLATATAYWWMADDQVRATALSRQAIEAAGGEDDPSAYLALETAGDVALATGDLDRAYAVYERAAQHALRAERHSDAVQAVAGMLLARTYAEGPTAAELALLREHEGLVVNPSVRAMALYAEAEAVAADEPEQALELFARARAIARETGNRLVVGVSMAAETALRGRVGGLDDTTLSRTIEAVELWLGSGNQNLFITCLRNAVSLLDRLHLFETAVEVVAATTAHTPDRPSYGIEAERMTRAMNRARTVLGTDQVDAVWRRAQGLDLETVARRVVADLAGVRQGGVSAGD
ncbi:BTAD domain-containing putative transcriptional regulator [Nocardioides bigeumensis]|uniref:BTAD domain-containing putative transcriptional regulator n=1 Tax=Nocardioides bigeumensis TaxID=433657 RepID=A0ABN2YGM7_9ACTN